MSALNLQLIAGFLRICGCALAFYHLLPDLWGNAIIQLSSLSTCLVIGLRHLEEVTQRMFLAPYRAANL